MQETLFPPAPGTVEWVAPGAARLAGFLSLDEQHWLAGRCRDLGGGPVGWYRPTVRGGGRMRVEMLCLGRHWNPLTYRYESTRADRDGAPAPPLPDDLAALACRVAAAAGMTLAPDICILNAYGTDGRMGLHQDKDEQPDTLAAGIPVVSISIGDTARFVLGGLRRRDPLQHLDLRSGDAFVFGGPARLRYHGVTRILPGTAPAPLGMTGRYNLTFRQY
ncbi:MAG: alpha-ketoglutarate-dependent dioxygenase AlkB [Acidobacteriota bacterium]|nr:alpha-ketoglutarate-dependent dioxygenase AlkB [Acidobacteriota bacterium]